MNKVQEKAHLFFSPKVVKFIEVKTDEYWHDPGQDLALHKHSNSGKARRREYDEGQHDINNIYHLSPWMTQDIWRGIFEHDNWH